MNKKFVYTISAAVAFSAMAFAATEDTQDAPVAESTITSAEVGSALINEDILKRLAALEENQTTAAQSGWESKVKVKGDIRYRFQYVQSEDKDTGSDLSTSKNIQRLRARLGIYADVNDFTEAAIGLRTGSGANSGNVTLGDGFDGLEISVSLAYLKFNPEDAKYGSLTMGKMKQPWKNTTDMIWDSDVNPEGIAYDYAGKVNNSGLFGSLGYYKVFDDLGKVVGLDADLTSAQAGISQPFGDNIKGTLGGSMYYYNHDAAAVPLYDINYRIGEGFADLGFKNIGPIPFKLYGNYVNNTAADTDNQGYCFGIKFGDAKKGKWEAKYDYRDLELYAAPGAFTDSDFADGGSGVKGHRIKGKYNFAKNLQGGVALIIAERTPLRIGEPYSQQFNSLFLDLMVKF